MTLHKIAQQGKALLLALTLAGALSGAPCQAQSLGGALDELSEQTYYFLRDNVFNSRKPDAPVLYPDEQTGLPVEKQATPQQQHPGSYRQKTYVVGVRG